jgi:hypothetical protein
MMFELTWKPVSSRFVSYRVIRSFSRAVWPITNQCEIPGPKAQNNLQRGESNLERTSIDAKSSRDLHRREQKQLVRSLGIALFDGGKGAGGVAYFAVDGAGN